MPTNTPVNLQPADLKHLVPGKTSFMWALMKAVANNQSSTQNSQIIGALSTQFAAQIESDLYAYWNGTGGPLAADNAQIAYWAGQKDNNHVSQWQSQYQADSAKAQAAESQADAPVQSGEQQNNALANDQSTVSKTGEAGLDFQKTANGALMQLIS